MTAILNILIGLLGLGIVVFFHEMGHMIAAKRVGIEVQAFSLGWGKKLVSKQIGSTEYRISVFPIGGYVKMKGEHALLQAWEQKTETIEKEPGSFFAASWWRRTVVSLAGPVTNLLLSIVILTFVYTLGNTIETFEPRIVPAENLSAQMNIDRAPALEAGLEAGDRIVSIDGEEVQHYRDIQQEVAVSAGETIEVVYERGGTLRTTTVDVALDTSSGAGVIGIYPLIEPVIESVEPNSPADRAGIMPGDRIVTVGGTDVETSIQVSRAINENPSRVEIVVERTGARQELVVEPDIVESQPRIGVRFGGAVRVTERLPVFQSAGRAVSETFRNFALTIRSIQLLFRGVDATQALSGPIRITVLVGEVATQGFTLGFGAGLSAFFSFIALISVALAFMNLLPIPVLDGGQILLFLVEAVTRKPPKPRVVYYYQVIGSILVFALLAFAVFSDVLFFVRR